MSEEAKSIVQNGRLSLLLIFAAMARSASDALLMRVSSAHIVLWHMAFRFLFFDRFNRIPLQVRQIVF